MTESPPSRRERRHGAASEHVRRKLAQKVAAAEKARLAGRVGDALQGYADALRLDPNDVATLCSYATLLAAHDRPDLAVAPAARATQIEPASAPAHACLGRILRRAGQAAAKTPLARAFELAPTDPAPLYELALLHVDAGDPARAQPFLDRALELDPGSTLAQLALGRFYAITGRIDDAIAALERAVALDPTNAEAGERLGVLLRDAGNHAAAIDLLRHVVDVAPRRASAWSSLLLTLQCSDEASVAFTAEVHRQFGRTFARDVRPLPPVRTFPLDGRRLRIGYVSSNFRRHAISKFFEPLLERHDARRFDVYCYHNFPVEDDVTQGIRRRSARFASIWSQPDGLVAAQIRRDGIDILVDLDGHTSPNRLPLFLLRPAPVQVSWLGYLGTTGLTAIDYRMTDARADPVGATDRLHVEELWRLPATAWCYRPYAEAPDPGPPPFESSGGVTFACLNNPGKVTATALDAWARILLAVDASRLVLHASAQPSRLAALRRFFTERGIADARLRLVPRQAIGAYLATFHSSDIALDTMPCAGGTTTCDALWAGVPVVTVAGTASFARSGASLLAHVGLSDLVAQSVEDYVLRATALARDPARLRDLRARLRATMRASRLMDEVSFAVDVENAYLEMWARRSRRVS